MVYDRMSQDGQIATKGQPKGAQVHTKGAKGNQKLGQRKPKGQNRVHGENIFHDKYTMMIQPKRKQSFIQ